MTQENDKLPRVVIVVDGGVAEEDSRLSIGNTSVYIVDIENLKTIGDDKERNEYIRDNFPPDLAEWAIRRTSNEGDDFHMTSDQLREKYDSRAADSRWGEHGRYVMEDWRSEVENCTTRLGYWEWVRHCLEGEE